MIIQNLEYKPIADRDMQLATARNEISNYNQSQYILGQMGRYVAWAGSGSQATVANG